MSENDVMVCGMCDKPIRFNGLGWAHVDGLPRHPAVPKAEWDRIKSSAIAHDSDLATARRLIAEAEERARTAEADAAALRDLLQEVVFSVPSGTALRSRLAQKLGEPNPGAPLVRERDDAQRDARQLAEALEIEHAARLQAEADAAALRAKLAELIADDNESLCNCGVLLPLFERNVRDIKALLATAHPGAALLAELEAARTVVEAAREAKKHQPLRKVLRDALSAYDAARGREG